MVALVKEYGESVQKKLPHIRRFTRIQCLIRDFALLLNKGTQSFASKSHVKVFTRYQ